MKFFLRLTIKGGLQSRATYIFSAYQNV